MSVEPWTAKGVELAIDFYGSRQRPPHGVLSESHLNSLAIALFLAMAETFNEQLGFLAARRRDQQLRRRASRATGRAAGRRVLRLAAHRPHPRPAVLRTPEPPRAVVAEARVHVLELRVGAAHDAVRNVGHSRSARERLESGDVHGAATKARRALEELLQEVCEALWAPLPFRRGQANDKREIGELFKGLRRTLKERAKPLLESIEPLLKNLEADVGATLNVAVHGSRGRTGSERSGGRAEAHRGAGPDVVVSRRAGRASGTVEPPRRDAANAARARSRRSV